MKARKIITYILSTMSLISLPLLTISCSNKYKDTPTNNNQQTTGDNKDTPTNNNQQTTEDNKDTPINNNQQTTGDNKDTPTNNNEQTTAKKIEEIIKNSINIDKLDKPEIDENFFSTIKDKIRNPSDLINYKPESKQKYYEFSKWIDKTTNKEVDSNTKWENITSLWDYNTNLKTQLEENIKEYESMSIEDKNKYGYLNDDKIVEDKQSMKNIKIYISKEIEYFENINNLLTKSATILNNQIKEISKDKNNPFANVEIVILEKNKEHLPSEYKVTLFDGTVRNPCNNNFALACLNTDTLFKKHKIFISTAIVDKNKILYNSSQFGIIDFNRLYSVSEHEKEVAKQEIIIHELGHIFGLKDHYLHKEQEEGVYKLKNTQSSYYSHLFFITDTTKLISTKPGLKEFDLRELKRRYVDY